MNAVIAASGLGKAYRRTWALRDCTLAIPEGHVVGLVGPNGAGKTTLLRLATGMLTPTRGTITVLGERPAAGPAQLARVGFVAQDTAVYARLTVADHLRLGAWLNPGWDDDLARQRIGQLALDPKQRAGSLSGGQRAQLALTLAMAKRPELLILDEPVASLDPLARREFLRGLMEAVAEQRLSVVLSSHLVADLERVCLPGQPRGWLLSSGPVNAAGRSTSPWPWPGTASGGSAAFPEKARTRVPRRPAPPARAAVYGTELPSSALPPWPAPRWTSPSPSWPSSPSTRNKQPPLAAASPAGIYGRGMDDKKIMASIDELIETEHRLRQQLAAGELTAPEEHEQLRATEEALDQCWDLLRQRRARREFGEDPDAAAARPVSEVEGYQQ
jgi:ABC-type multidrug transport system ATPase subunit